MDKYVHCVIRVNGEVVKVAGRISVVDGKYGIVFSVAHNAEDILVASAFASLLALPVYVIDTIRAQISSVEAPRPRMMWDVVQYHMQEPQTEVDDDSFVSQYRMH